MHNKINNISIWEKLSEYSNVINKPSKHLKELIKDKKRFKKFSLQIPGFFYDFSHQRVDEKVMHLLFELAENKKIMQKFNDMLNGKKINNTENRAALHTAARDFSNNKIFVDNEDIMPKIKEIREDIKNFSQKIHNGEIKASNNKPFKHIVVIGIGGSYLGTEFISYSLQHLANKNIKIHFLANVDPYDFELIVSEIIPSQTLWIIISKSFTTVETMSNAGHAYMFMKEIGLDSAKHFVKITAQEEDKLKDPLPMLKSFKMYDFVGGRYSVSSAVGGVPLSLYLGYENFEKILKGANEMDLHTKNTPIEKNIPLIAALLSIWNNNFLGYDALAIIPYSSALRKLSQHIQQLYMESNGKSVTTDGEYLNTSSGCIIFGEPGTNAQHSFFQLAHQGKISFPTDFIGVASEPYDHSYYTSNGINKHQELMANLIAQSNALAIGKESEDKSRAFEGNRPSSIILLQDLSPENIGRILSFYEAKTVLEAFILNINPFDQFGVELGKIMAKEIRQEILSKNRNNEYEFKTDEPSKLFYLNSIFQNR